MTDSSMKPFSTYPEDRAKLVALADEVIANSDDCGAVDLADHVKAILKDEEVALDLQGELVRLLRDANNMLAFSFNRIHCLPRSRDTELASDIGKVMARIQPVLKFYDGRQDQ